MSSRFADPNTMRTRSPIYHDDAPKRPPPSPSNKAPPSKKLDAKSRAVSEEPFKAQAAALLSEPLAESCPDKSSGNRMVIEMSVFKQILELDDDEQEFSREMVKDYITQAETTIKLMDECYANEELTKLSEQGHFLKGSSAALGAVQVQEVCKKIQHLGKRLDPDKEPEAKISVDEAFARIRPLLTRLKDEQAAATKCLNILVGHKP